MTREMKMEVREYTQPNFGNVKYVAILDGEIVGDGNTPEIAQSRALRALKAAYDLYHYGGTDLQ
jgi:hypothetical protein